MDQTLMSTKLIYGLIYEFIYPRSIPTMDHFCHPLLVNIPHRFKHTKSINVVKYSEGGFDLTLPGL